MKSTRLNALLFGVIFAALALLPLCSRAQSLPASVGSSIEVVRASARADRVTVITAAMNFSDKEGTAFWPLYRKYDYERSTLDDRRVAVIKEYAAKYPSLTDGEAKDMAAKMLDCDATLAALKRKYFKKFNAVLPGLTVAKFFQVEHRIDLLMDMQVESSIPILDPPRTEPAH